MGLEAIIKNSVKLAFDLMDSLGKNGTYRRVLSTGFDPVTRKPQKTTEDHSIRGLPVDFVKREVDGEMIKSSDIQLYVLSDLITWTPKNDDQVIILGETWEIVDWKDIEYQGAAHWFQLRKP